MACIRFPLLTPKKANQTVTFIALDNCRPKTVVIKLLTSNSP